MLSMFHFFNSIQHIMLSKPLAAVNNSGETGINNGKEFGWTGNPNSDLLL